MVSALSSQQKTEEAITHYLHATRARRDHVRSTPDTRQPSETSFNPSSAGWSRTISSKDENFISREPRKPDTSICHPPRYAWPVSSAPSMHATCGL